MPVIDGRGILDFLGGTIGGIDFVVIVEFEINLFVVNELLDVD
jgi:hypothetical protein